jgi:hypothetical protein
MAIEARQNPAMVPVSRNDLQEAKKACDTEAVRDTR